MTVRKSAGKLTEILEGKDMPLSPKAKTLATTAIVTEAELPRGTFLLWVNISNIF